MYIVYHVRLPVTPRIVVFLTGPSWRRLLHRARTDASWLRGLLLCDLSSSRKIIPEGLLVLSWTGGRCAKRIPEVCFLRCFASCPWRHSIITFYKTVEGLCHGFCASLQVLAQLACLYSSLCGKITLSKLDNKISNDFAELRVRNSPSRDWALTTQCIRHSLAC